MWAMHAKTPDYSEIIPVKKMQHCGMCFLPQQTSIIKVLRLLIPLSGQQRNTNNKWSSRDSCKSVKSGRTPVEITRESAADRQSASAATVYHIQQVPKSIRGRGSRLPGCAASSLLLTPDLRFSQDDAVRLLIGLRGAQSKSPAETLEPQEGAHNLGRDWSGTSLRCLAETLRSGDHILYTRHLLHVHVPSYIV